LSRIKFVIRARVLIVFTIKRSTCLCLTLDSVWSKKNPTVLIIEKKIIVHCSSSTTVIKFSTAAPLPSATPQPIIAANPPPRRLAHQSTDPHRFTTSNTPAAPSQQEVLTSSSGSLGYNNLSPRHHNQLTQTPATPQPLPRLASYYYLTWQIPVENNNSQPQQVTHTSSNRSSAAAAHQPVHPLPAIGISDIQPVTTPKFSSNIFWKFMIYFFFKKFRQGCP